MKIKQTITRTLSVIILTAASVHAETLEEIVVDTVESGSMTKDLALLVGPDQKWLTTEGFLEKINENLNAAV